MPRDLPLSLHTIAADLLQRSLDLQFDEQFPDNGSFVRRSLKGRDYFYYQAYDKAGAGRKRSSIYVGPAADPAIADRVARFQSAKQQRKANASLVSALTASGLPRPPIMIGRVIDVLARAGIFRLRSVLVGTAAYQTYPFLLGQFLDEAAAITQDIDIAQFRSISFAVDDQSDDLLESLRKADATFRSVPHLTNPLAVIAFENQTGLRIDILAPNRGSDDFMSEPLAMPALTGASAQPLRFLDYLIYEPVRSLVLHGPGIPVLVPQPARFAVHKMIVSGRRLTDAAGRAKARKDRIQASEIILALAAANQFAICAEALEEALARGPKWRAALQSAAGMLSAPARALIAPLLRGN